MCEESHNALMSLYNICPFCDLTLCEVVVVNTMCCDNVNIVEDDSIRRCTNCYWFEYPYSTEYINYYENRHRIRRKSIYIRKYQFVKTINLFTSDIMWDEKLILYKIFESLQKTINHVKRSIKFSYLIRRILEMKGDELYCCFPLPKSKMTLLKYENLTNIPLKTLSSNIIFIKFSRRH